MIDLITRYRYSAMWLGYVTYIAVVWRIVEVTRP